MGEKRPRTFAELAPSAAPADAAATVAHPFGELLRRYRLARGLTQAKLAERAGLSTRGVNDLERGARISPHPATVALLADALSLTADERAAFTASVRRAHAIPSERAPTSAAFAPPTGTVTFLFTDIEQSTHLLQRLGADYREALAAHQRLLRDAFATQEGYEVDSQGDSFFVAFPTAHAALEAAAQAQRALADYPWPEGITVRVRMGLHTGAPTLVGARYIGLDVHRAARIGAAAHGGQVVLSSATAALAQSAPEGVPAATDLRDLGTHRLKDLSAPEHLWQLVVAGLPEAFPPPRALDRHAHNLPIQPTALLGREREVAEIARLLQGDAWLVSVTGPPGVGKTRLALQVGGELVGAEDIFPDGIWFVRLARLADPALVIPTIAGELGLREGGASFIANMLRDYLADKRLLLIIDNFEHVAAAASELADVLHHAPGVRTLVTSRSPLHLRGEHEYALAPLPIPVANADGSSSATLVELAPFASVNLFCERAQASVADFTLTPANASPVGAICARLDGLPLALELAAARVKLLPPRALLTRLARALPLLSSGGPRDVDERQRTMRATLAWSYNLLQPEERTLFRRLAVFAGGATLEAIEQVCVAPEGARPLTLDLLDLLGALMDASLVQRRDEPEAPRFTLLFVARQYGLERLEASGEAGALRRAHAQWCSQLARAPGPLSGRGNLAWLARMEADQDNLRAAVEWKPEQDEAESSWQLVIGAAQLWYVRGNLREGRLRLEQVLQDATLTTQGTHVGEVDATDSEGMRSETLYWVRHWAALLAFETGDCDASTAHWKRALACAFAIEKSSLVALALFGLARTTGHHSGAAASSIALARKAIAIARQSKDDAILAEILAEFGYLYVGTLVPPEERRNLAEEGLWLAKRQGDGYAESIAVYNLWWYAVESGDMERARAYVSPVMRTAIEKSHLAWIPYYFDAVASIANRSGHVARFARLKGVADAAFERSGQSRLDNEQELAEAEAVITQARAALSEERWAAEVAAGRNMPLEDAVAEALREARNDAG